MKKLLAKGFIILFILGLAYMCYCLIAEIGMFIFIMVILGGLIAGFLCDLLFLALSIEDE